MLEMLAASAEQLQTRKISSVRDATSTPVIKRLQRRLASQNWYRHMFRRMLNYLILWSIGSGKGERPRELHQAGWM
jgi:hypothetical protein